MIASPSVTPRHANGSTDVEKGPAVILTEDVKGSRKAIAIYSAIFFCAMIAHELALEAASNDPQFKGLDSLPYAVTLFQFGFCVLMPFIASKGKALNRFPSLKKPKEFLPYIKLSVVVFGATGVSSMSLKYVTYPTKVIFKSAKLIPTMIVSTLFHAKRYSSMEYFAALLLCMGAAGYSMGSGSSDDDQSSQWEGIVLLLISILCDAIVPNLQQTLMTSSSPATAVTSNSNAKNLSAAELMINTNAVGFVGLLIYTKFAGHLIPAIQVSLLHPKLVVYLILVGTGLGCAVLAYTRLIKASGSVVAVAVATLRKVATMVLSYLVFPKPLSQMHIVSGVLVLAGIFISTHAKQHRHQQ